MARQAQEARHLGLWGATGVGVGAIVGGGILALAGVAFEVAGPSAMLAFGLNGALAALTARSFAELARRFPESGGTYTFAKKVLSVEAAFLVGWVVWFASIVAAVLYALGFAAFALPVLERAWAAFGGAPPPWLGGSVALHAVAIGATAAYAAGLVRRSGGGGQWATAGKVIAFVVLILGGAWTFASEPPPDLGAQLRPFFAGGAAGLVQAMGYTFIALQGFDLVAAVGGEVREPERNLPRSMFLALGIALAIYIPLLFLTTTVGVAPGESIAAASAADPETILARAAGRFLGPAGYWLVVVAAVLSMLSALHANLFGASRIALAMARDRNLPTALSRLRPRSGAPAAAILATAAGACALLLVVPGVAAAGAASSLIFLLTFAIAHGTSLLVRRRLEPGRRVAPAAALAPVVGALACLSLALFQGFAVRSAGAVAGVWLAFGTLLYLSVFAPRARVADAAAQALDPELAQLRGLSPLVLVPIANPASGRSLVEVASAVAAPGVGRVLLLSVVAPPDREAVEAELPQLRDVQSVLSESLRASFRGSVSPETLITVAEQPWAEIARVARIHRCESLLLGLGRIEGGAVESRVETLMGQVDADVVVLRAPPGWQLSSVRRILVPLGGRRDHSRLRARLLGSLRRSGAREATFLRVLPETSTPAELRRARGELEQLVGDESPGLGTMEVVRSADAAAELARRAAEHDLVVLGIRRHARRRKAFGDLAVRLARATDRPLVLISRRG